MIELRDAGDGVRSALSVRVATNANVDLSSMPGSC